MQYLTDGNVICNKCKAEAWSKCPHCRTVFPIFEFDWSIEQLDCDHNWEYKPGNKCIYGCGYSTQ